ncbi:MAG: hypothetical protein H0V61_06710 [Chitinophagales bacterium]|nr:hypothetical protein [Chitinophagales bacterium]
MEFGDHAWGAGGQYQRTLKSPISLALAFQYGYGSIASDVDFAEPDNLGITLARSVYHTDIAVGYPFLGNRSSTIIWGLYGGITYVWGDEIILLVYNPSPPYSFP